MIVIKGLKKIYKNMDPHYRDKMFEDNCKIRKSTIKISDGHNNDRAGSCKGFSISRIVSLVYAKLARFIS